MGNQNNNGQSGKDNIPTTNRDSKGKVEQMAPIVFEAGPGNNPGKDEQGSSNNSNTKGNQFSQLSRFTANTATKSSVRVGAVINFNDLSVIMENQEVLGKNNEASVPFSVVKLSIDKKLDECINKLYPDFYYDFRDISGNKQTHWRINSKGYYLKFIKPDKLAILKPGYLYYGKYKQQRGDYIPDSHGRLLTQRGMYVGNFNHGQAHGQGSYSDNIDGSVCKGTWINGEIRNGEIENKYYKYHGQFVDGIAQGKGVIQYIENNASYKGHFRHGIYEDEEGYFECDMYYYSGAFKEGKKEGIGCLIEKQRFIKGKTKRYKPQEQFEGYFQNDYYKGRKKRADK